jgi:glycine/D-amino acid oxidase-like deaminating enzyme
MIDPESIRDLRRATVQLAGLAREGDEPNEDDLETIREGLCFRPVSQRGTPLVGKASDKHLNVQAGEGGVYIASGHGPWGISLSLGTGKVISEMIMGQKTSADVKALRIGS